jgi:hypothetical protein
MTTTSDLGRALVALRPTTTITCEVCGTEKTVRQSTRWPARTCSPACRQQLYRREKKARRCPGRDTSGL